MKKNLLLKFLKKKKYLGTNYSAYLRYLDMKNNHFKFKKAYKIIKKKKFVKSYNIKNKFQGIEIYPYDKIFDTFDELIKQNRSIFIGK